MHTATAPRQIISIWQPATTMRAASRLNFAIMTTTAALSASFSGSRSYRRLTRRFLGHPP
jgi:hypothetical protein